MLTATRQRATRPQRSAAASEPLQYRGYPVELEAFSGPLDLLLSLIRREQIDIFDIPIASITDQYLAALADLQQNRVPLAGEFMVMAATLMQIKARMLLPKPPPVEGEEEAEDPRAELVRLLLDYETFRQAAQLLGDLARERERLALGPAEEHDAGRVELRPMTMTALVQAFERALARSVVPEVPAVREQVHTVAERSVRLLGLVREGAVRFDTIFAATATRLEMAVTFMALLELIRGGQLIARQEGLFGELWLERGAGRRNGR